MKTALSRALWGAGFVAGLSLMGVGAAHADTTGEDGILSGNQVLGSVELPVTVGGNAISVLGDSHSSKAATASASSGSNASPAAPAAPAKTSGADSVGGGNQVAPVVKVPVKVGCNAISVIGDSTTADAATSGSHNSSGRDNAGNDTSGDRSVAGGNQVAPVVDLPIVASGNAISVIGDSSTEGSTASSGSGDPASTDSGSATNGTEGLGSGNQILPVVNAPIVVGGNAISVIGDSSSDGATAGSGSDSGSSTGGSTTDGSDGVAGGNQIIPGVELPVVVGGNAISVIGDSSTGGSTATPTVPVTPVDPTDPVTPVDPTDPTDPTVPTNPVTPVDPGTGTDGGIAVGGGVTVGGGVAVGGAGSPVAVVGAANGAVAAAAALAITGADVRAPMMLVGILLAAGLAMMLLGRRATLFV